MATRSRIGKLEKDGKIKSIYCHFDGYIDGVGEKLKDIYNTEEKIDKLLDLGDLSVLEVELEPQPSQPHTFVNPQKNVCIAYGRDRGETDTKAKIHSSEITFLKFKEEYTYLFKNEKWYFYNKKIWELV